MSASPWQLASDTTCDYWHQFQQRRALEGMLAQLPFANLELRKTKDRLQFTIDFFSIALWPVH